MAEDCKRLIHLSDSAHRNYEGPVECPNCGAVMEVEIRDGKVILLKHS
ncbi:MAG: hypothetical protein ACE5Z5_05030 [Candidatus Bathyarchaeia archaeon]